MDATIVRGSHCYAHSLDRPLRRCGGPRSGQDRHRLARATYGFSEDLIADVQDQPLGASGCNPPGDAGGQPQEIADIRDEPPSPVREIAMRAAIVPASLCRW